MSIEVGDNIGAFEVMSKPTANKFKVQCIFCDRVDTVALPISTVCDCRLHRTINALQDRADQLVESVDKLAEAKGLDPVALAAFRHVQKLIRSVESRNPLE